MPSSTTVTPGAATRWPSRPANAEVPLRLKSPSRPWPTASCSRMPGQPGPSTTSIVPAGQGTRLEVHERDAHRLVDERLPARRVEQRAELDAPAAALVADLAPPAPSLAITCTLRRTSGRTSPTSVPSLAATSTLAVLRRRTLAITCTMRGSRERA